MTVLGKNHKIGIFILLWLLPISLTILNISRNYVTMSTITVGILSFILILINPKTSLLAIPFFTLLSPIAGFINIFSIHLLLSDFLFLLLGTQAIYLFLTKKIIINSRGLLILEVFIPFVFLFSTIFGIISQTLVTPRPILLLGQLIIVYYYTKNFAVDEEGWTAILNAWVAATILGSLLLLHSFIIGIDLSAFEQSYNRVLAGRSPDTQATFLIQPRYYYTTFHFALGISTIILIIKFIFSPHRKKIKIIIPLIILLIAIIVLQNKTTIFSIAGALTTFFIFYFFKSKIVRKKTLLLSLLFASMIAPTDPIAVIGIFKELGVGKSLSVLIEGESLFNDGVAIVLFRIISYLLLRMPTCSIFEVGIFFPFFKKSPTFIIAVVSISRI